MKKQNLIGQRFERLTVIEELPSKNEKPKRPRWKCKCDCGNEIVVNRGYDLKCRNIQSCGCLRSEEMSKKASIRNFDNRKYEPKIAAAKRVYLDQYSDGDLTFEQFLELSQQNCYYCGAQPNNISKPKNKRSSDFYTENAQYTYSGLDRIDSKLPHNYYNLVPCCRWCNYAKRERTQEQFYKWAYELYTNLQKKTGS